MDSHFSEWKEWALQLVLEEMNEILILLMSSRHMQVLCMVEYSSAKKKNQ